MSAANLRVDVRVPSDRRVIVQLPDDVEPGEATLTVVVHPKRLPQRSASLDWFPTLNVTQWEPATSLRREDLYGDDQR